VIKLPLAAFALYDEDAVNKAEAGKYTVSIGGSQPDGRSERLTGKETAKLQVEIRETVVLK